MRALGGIMRFVTVACILVLASGPAMAGAALDDANGSGSGSGSGSATGSASGSGSTTDATATTEPAAADVVHYGFDVGVRETFVPSGLLGLFLDHVPGGVANTGGRLDLVRKRGNLELQLGFEYEHITPAAGVYVNKGDGPNIAPSASSQAAVDYILPNASLAWFTVEFTFLNHAPITKWLAFRYGGGVGLGILTGSVPRYKVFCGAGASLSNLSPACTPPEVSSGGKATLDTADLPNQPQPEDTPPVFPVVNAIIGFQLRPIDKLVINLEGGIRTMPFIGTSIGYFF
jgi:hypothetical protein